jgi:hypothetical protein
MPNITLNNVTIEGDAAELQQIADTDFNFHTIYPCPIECRVKCWGTNKLAEDIDLTYEKGDSTLSVAFHSAWKPPNTFLTHLTLKYPSLKIKNVWNDNYDLIGFSTYLNKEFKCVYFNPAEYTLDALKAFSEIHTWFDYEMIEDYRIDFDCHNDSVYDDGTLQKEVVVNHYHTTIDKMFQPKYEEAFHLSALDWFKSLQLYQIGLDPFGHTDLSYH